MKRGTKEPTKEEPKSKASGKPDGKHDEGFDEILGNLATVVERLETGDLGLEAALAAYEEGVGLARRGHTLLDRAEQRVELLSVGDDGPPRKFPQDEDDEDDEDEDDDS